MRGMSQEELAAKAGMSRSHLSATEAPNIARAFSLEASKDLIDAKIFSDVANTQRKIT